MAGLGIAWRCLFRFMKLSAKEGFDQMSCNETQVLTSVLILCQISEMSLTNNQ